MPALNTPLLDTYWSVIFDEFWHPIFAEDEQRYINRTNVRVLISYDSEIAYNSNNAYDIHVSQTNNWTNR